jgi:Tetracyclin repressor-like, C-terminal domain
VARQLELLVAHRRATMREHGARGLLEVFDRINRDLARSKPLRRLLQQEPSGGMRLLTSTGGVVQPRAVACVEELIVDEVRAGRYDPPADPGTLAYAVVRLAEAFLYNDASSDIRGDYRRLREVQAALLGVPRESGPPASPRATSF